MTLTFCLIYLQMMVNVYLFTEIVEHNSTPLNHCSFTKYKIFHPTLMEIVSLYMASKFFATFSLALMISAILNLHLLHPESAAKSTNFSTETEKPCPNSREPWRAKPGPRTLTTWTPWATWTTSATRLRRPPRGASWRMSLTRRWTLDRRRMRIRHLCNIRRTTTKGNGHKIIYLYKW